LAGGASSGSAGKNCCCKRQQQMGAGREWAELGAAAERHRENQTTEMICRKKQKNEWSEAAKGISTGI